MKTHEQLKAVEVNASTSTDSSDDAATESNRQNGDGGSNETSGDNAEVSDSPETIVRSVFAGVDVYANYTGDAKCVQTADDPDQIGSAMWDYQVSLYYAKTNLFPLKFQVLMAATRYHGNLPLP